MSTLRAALEEALAANPDDLATHMAYADLLTEQGDPRGELVQVQLALEDPSRPAKERAELQRREKALLEAHQREWLGDLAELLLTPKAMAYQPADGLFGLGYFHPGSEFAFRRGWLHALKLCNFNTPVAQALCRASAARLLRELTIDDSPEYEDPGYGALAEAPFLGCVRRFQLGPQQDSSHTPGEGALALVQRMPRIEELYLYAHNVELEEVFALPMPNLRALHVWNINTEYPLGALAANPSLTNLVELSFWPHALEPGDPEGYIQPGPFRELCFSPHLRSLTHLVVYLSEIGDDGARALVESGMLRRLRVLDLNNGCITDEGARALAASPDLRRLERLRISANGLTEAGIAALQATGVTLEATPQYNAGSLEDREYLWYGDCE